MIPTAVLHDTLTIEPFAGRAAEGPLYDAPVVARGLLSFKRSSVTLPDGSQGATVAVALMRPSVACPVLSRVTVGGATFIALSVSVMHQLSRDYCLSVALGRADA